MAVEQRALRVGAQQRLVGMLTVDVDEELADFAQLQGGCRRAVDIAARAAAGMMIDSPTTTQETITKPLQTGVAIATLSAVIGPPRMPG